MKVTTKIAKSGARLFYVDSKRVSRDKALESAAQNRVGNPFVIEYDTEQNHYPVQGGIEKHVYTSRKTFDTLKLRIDSYKGFTVYCDTCKLRWFACNTGAKNFAAKIEDAFIDGEHGVKITVDGTISILPDIDDYAVTVDAQDSAIESEIQNAGTVAEMSTISITEYNTMLSWAEKISNGQRDAVTQIKTHAKKWFNVDADKEEIIGIIEDGGLNGFRNNFLAKINFRVQDNAGYFHKLCKCGEDNYVLCEMPAEPKTVDAEIELAEIDEDEAAEKFYRETESIYRKMQSDVYFAHEFLREHVFDIYDDDYALSVRNQRNEYKACPNKFHLVDTRFDVEVDRNELDYVIYYGRTELARYSKIESVNNAVDRLVIAIVNHRFEFAFPTELPDENASEIIQIDTNGTTEIGAETVNFCNAKSAPTANFDAQVADALKAAHVAKAILDEKDAVVEKAKAESRKACDVYEAAKADILKLYERKAAELTAKIKPPKRFLKVIKQDGREDFIRKDLFVHVYEGYDWDKHFSTYHFAIAKYDIREGNRLGIYDTPAQVEAVILELKAAIKRGDEKFIFPTVEDLSSTEISALTA